MDKEMYSLYSCGESFFYNVAFSFIILYSSLRTGICPCGDLLQLSLLLLYYIVENVFTVTSVLGVNTLEITFYLI